MDSWQLGDRVNGVYLGGGRVIRLRPCPSILCDNGVLVIGSQRVLEKLGWKLGATAALQVRFAQRFREVSLIK